MRLLLLLSVLLMSGCGSDSVQSPPLSAGPPAPPPVISEARLSGNVFLGVAVPGARVSVQAPDGRVLQETVTSATGNFLVRGTLPADLRLVARLPGSSLEFAAEVRGMTGRRHQPINILTSLASDYLRSHPGTSLADADARVRRKFGIPAGLDLGYGIEESPRAPFSHVAFLLEAGLQGGYAAYSARVLDTPSGGHLLTPQVLSASITGLEPGLQEWATQTQAQLARTVRYSLGSHYPLRREAVRARSLVLAFTAEAYPFLFGVAQGVTGNLITGIPGALGSLFNLLGFNFTTSGKLTAIQDTLNQVQSELLALQNQEQLDTLAIEIGDLDDQVNPIHNAFVSYAAVANNTPPPPATPTPIGVNGGPFTLPGAATGLATFSQSGQDLTNYLSKIGQYMGIGGGPNQPNVIAQSAALVAPKYGLDQQAATFNLPVRDNNKVSQTQTEAGIYRSYQIQGLTLVSENCHTYSTTIPDPVNMTVVDANSAVRQLQRVSLSLKGQSQQVPLELPRDDIIVDLEFGLMWYAPMFAADKWSDANENASLMVVQGTGADGSVVTYDDWRLPTYQECRALQLRGRYNAATNTSQPPLPYESNNGYADTGLTSNGLQALGFTNLGSAWSDNDSAQDGDILYAAYQYIGAARHSTPFWCVGFAEYDSNGGFYYQPDPPVAGTNLIFRLNHQSSTTSTSTSKQPYLVCRSITNDPDKAVLDAPLDGSSVTQRGNSSEGLPWGSAVVQLDVNPVNPVQPGEYPSLGVVTALSPPVFTPAAPAPSPFNLPAGALQLATGVTCQVTLGGSFRVGKTNNGQDLSLHRLQFSSPPVMTVDGSNRPNLLANLIGFQSANPSALLVSNIPEIQGLAIPYATTPVQVTVQCLAPTSTTTFANIVNNTTLNPPTTADRSLVALQIAPRNLALGTASLAAPYNQTSGRLPLSLTAFYADGSLESLATSNTNPPRPANANVTWTVTPAGAASVSVDGATVQLVYAPPPGAPAGTRTLFNVTATYGGLTDTTMFRVDGP